MGVAYVSVTLQRLNETCLSNCLLDQVRVWISFPIVNLIPGQSSQNDAVKSYHISTGISDRTVWMCVCVRVCDYVGQTLVLARVFFCACDRCGDLNVHEQESSSFPPTEGTQGHILLAANERGERKHPLIMPSIGCLCARRWVGAGEEIKEAGCHRHNNVSDRQWHTTYSTRQIIFGMATICLIEIQNVNSKTRLEIMTGWVLHKSLKSVSKNSQVKGEMTLRE